MNVLELFAKLGLDTSEYESGLKGAQSSLSSFGGAVADGFGTVAKVGAAALTAASGAVVAFGATSVKTGMEFDKSMSQVAATMGKSMSEMENEVGSTTVTLNGQVQEFSGNLREFAQYMGANTAFSASQAADALNYMALAGYDTQESMSMLPNVLNLAAAGNMELARASDMVTDAQTALGLSFDETNQLVDMMAKTASSTNTSVEQLGDAILTIGGTAKIMSGGTTELNASLGILADNGIKGAEGGTKLRNVLLSLSAPTDKAAELLEGLGVKTSDAEGNLRPLQDIMGELGTSLDGLGTAERADIINTIFNKQDIAAVNALLDTSNERWDELGGLIDNATGSAAQMAETQLDNLDGDIIKMKSALEGAQIAISDGLSPTLREFVQFGTDGIGKLADAFKEGGFAGAMGELGTLISDGLAMITEKIPEVIDAAMTLLGALGQGLIDNAPVLFDALIEIGGMINEKLLEILQNAADNLGNVNWGKVAVIIQEGLFSVFSNLSEYAEIGAQIILELGNGLSRTIYTLSSSVTEIVVSMIDWISEKAPEFISVAASIIESLATGLGNALPTLLPAITNMIISIVTGIVDNADKLIDGAIALITGLADGLIDSIDILLDKAPEIIGKLAEAIIKAAPKLVTLGPTLIAKIVLGIVQALPNLVLMGAKLVNELKNAVINAVPSLVQTGKEIVNGIIKGIYAAKDVFLKAIADLMSSALAEVKRFFGIKSPSRVMRDEVGKQLVYGLALGITDNEGIVDKAIENLSKNVMDGFDNALNTPTLDISKNITGKTISEVQLSTNNKESAILARMDAILAVMSQYFPEIAEKTTPAYNGIGIEAINRSLGVMTI